MASTQPAQRPASPEPDKPKTRWDSILTSTPVVLTVVATALAGLSSSEMTQSMYYRSLAAQHQSKAGDQWGFFQAKRIRQTSLEMTSQLLQGLAPPDDFDPSQLDDVTAQLLDARAKAADGNERAAAAAAKVKKVREKLAGLLAEEETRQSLPYLTGAALPKVEMLALEKKDSRDAVDDAVKAIRQRKTERETAGLVA